MTDFAACRLTSAALHRPSPEHEQVSNRHLCRPVGAVPDDRRQLLGRDRVVRNRLPSWIGDGALQVFRAKLAVDPIADGNAASASWQTHSRLCRSATVVHRAAHPLARAVNAQHLPRRVVARGRVI